MSKTIVIRCSSILCHDRGFYSGETEQECLAKAQEDGWYCQHSFINRGNKWLCQKCTNAKNGLKCSICKKPIKWGIATQSDSGALIVCAECIGENRNVLGLVGEGDIGT